VELSAVLKSLRVALIIAVLFISGIPVQSTVAASPLLPDLGMLKLRNFNIEVAGGQTRLRFTTIIANIGAGPFQVRGHDRNANDELFVDQAVQNSDGTWSSHSVPEYMMYFAGDGHSHWHLRDLEGYVLKNQAGGISAVGEKHGFCFFDNFEWKLTLPGAPSSGVYHGCGNFSDPEVTTGLSIGWGDRYVQKLPDQYINITGLPSGQYTVTATADVLGGFDERCEGNNSTTATIMISGTSVTVINAGKNVKAC
jgi:hypothetical protein